MFHSEMWAVRLPEGNASVAARHVYSGGHSTSGLAELAGDGFGLRSVFSGGTGFAGSSVADVIVAVDGVANEFANANCRAIPQIIVG